MQSAMIQKIKADEPLKNILDVIERDGAVVINGLMSDEDFKDLHNELDDVYAELADRFRDVRLALNQLADRLLNLDEGDRPTLI